MKRFDNSIGDGTDGFPSPDTFGQPPGTFGYARTPRARKADAFRALGPGWAILGSNQ
ncbi:Protein virilizer-like [Streptomyces hygroscopicus]|nr:Protein virilizer-like [Streptomyces hygroscopicus]